MQLSAEDQRNLRNAAADAWEQSSGLWRRLHARELFKKDPRVAKFDAATIILLVRIAWELWQIWKNSKNVQPSILLSQGEPVFGGQQ